MVTERKTVRRPLNITLQILATIAIYFPLYFMLISSLKTNDQIVHSYFSPVLPLQWSNYSTAFHSVIHNVWNSLLIGTASTLGTVVVSILTAYCFARFTFPGKTALFIGIASFLMIPGSLTLIPSFVLIVKLGLINTYWACILPYIAHGQIIFILVLRTFIEQTPKDLFDASTIDGASHLRTFRDVAFPLLKPIVFSLALINFLGHWNDFVWPLLVLPSDALKTVTVSLYAFTGVQQIEYGLLFAGFTIASVPLILLLGLNMKFFINGITSGAIKA